MGHFPEGPMNLTTHFISPSLERFEIFCLALDFAEVAFELLTCEIILHISGGCRVLCFESVSFPSICVISKHLRHFQAINIIYVISKPFVWLPDILSFSHPIEYAMHCNSDATRKRSKVNRCKSAS